MKSNVTTDVKIWRIQRSAQPGQKIPHLHMQTEVEKFPTVLLKTLKNPFSKNPLSVFSPSAAHPADPGIDP